MNNYTLKQYTTLRGVGFNPGSQRLLVSYGNQSLFLRLHSRLKRFCVKSWFIVSDWFTLKAQLELQSMR